MMKSLNLMEESVFIREAESGQDGRRIMSAVRALGKQKFIEFSL